MALSFPNPSRSYDPEHRRIRFWGHDRTVEVSFFLEEDALLRLEPDTPPVEASMLAAFDKARARIFEIATNLYNASRSKTGGVITDTDF